MTDKKNINNSLKNQDKNFNKNSTHENNQIIIDGCNVSGCSYYNPLGNYNCGGTKKCSQWSNCYFKQLARKTQECEELKKQLGTSEEWRIKAEGLNEKLELKNTRYHKALEEIEGIVKNFGSYAAWQEQRINKILDIINKAKGEGNE